MPFTFPINLNKHRKYPKNQKKREKMLSDFVRKSARDFSCGVLARFDSVARILLLFFGFASVSFGAVGERLAWANGLTLLGFFEQNLIPIKLYYNLPAQDKELTAEVKAGAIYYTLRNDEGDLLHALIPISNSAQIHIYKQKDEFRLDFIPIVSFKKEQILTLKVQVSPYIDIIEATKDKVLAGEFSNIFARSPATIMHKDDKLSILYERDYRLGETFGSPDIRASMIEVAKKPLFVFQYTNGNYYDSNGKEMAGFHFMPPVSYTRISSRFSLGRKHPVLRIVRPHYGVDYVASAGTPVRATAAGRVVFAGVRGGYGKVIEIAHNGGIKSLYAHLSSINIRTGAQVKAGTFIGKVGSTGLSTGAHLHFGLYKLNQPIDPLKRIRTVASELSGREKEKFLQLAKGLQERVLSVAQSVRFENGENYELFSKDFVGESSEASEINEESEASEIAQIGEREISQAVQKTE